MIESANFQNGQSSNTQIFNPITESTQEQMNKQSTNSNGQNTQKEAMIQQTNQQINDDIKPQIKEIMGKISVDLARTKNTTGKMKEETSQLIALGFEQGSVPSKKDKGKEEVNGIEQTRKSSTMSQGSQASKNQRQDADDDSIVKKNKLSLNVNEQSVNDHNELEKNYILDLEAKSEESKTPEKSASNADNYNNKKEESNNVSKTKSFIPQEMNQRDVTKIDSKQIQKDQEVTNPPNSLIKSNMPQNQFQTDYMSNQNFPQNQQSTATIRQPPLSQRQQPQEGSSQYQQQQQQQQPYQQSSTPSQNLTSIQKNLPSKEVKSSKKEAIIPSQHQPLVDPSSPFLNSNKIPSKASLSVATPNNNNSNNHQIASNQQQITSNNPPESLEEKDISDSKNLCDSRVSSTQNMAAKLFFLEQENEMLNKENALLRLKNEFLNNRLNEVHRQNSNFSNNSSFNNNNNSSSNAQNMFYNISNQQQPLGRQANQTTFTPQQSMILKSTGNFPEQSPARSNLQPNSQIENNNNNKNYLNNTNIQTSPQQQQQQQSPILRAQQTTINDLQNNTSNKDTLSNYQNILASLCQLLQVNQPSQLIPTAQTYQKCIQKIPKLEKFIQNVYAIVLPGVPYEQLASRASMEEVCNQIQTWRNQQIQTQHNNSQQKFYLEFYKRFSQLFNNADSSSKQLDPYNILLSLHSTLDEFSIFQKRLKEILEIDAFTRTDLAFKMALDRLQQYSSSRWFTKDLVRITGITDLTQLYSEIEKSLIVKSRVTPMNANITLGRFE